MDKYLYPKDFIRAIYIDNLNDIVNKHNYFYISFGLIGTGMEFIGKCINEFKNPTWHDKHLGTENFNIVLSQLMPSYLPFKSKYKLCDSLRNGMAHAFQPKNNIELTHQKEADERGWKHLSENSRHRLVLICEILYDDFSNACYEVIRRVENNEFDTNGKMYKPFLKI